MRLSVFLFHESRHPGADGQTIHEAIAEAQLAESLGMDAAFLAEHHFDGNCASITPALRNQSHQIRVSVALPCYKAPHHPLKSLQHARNRSQGKGPCQPRPASSSSSAAPTTR